MLMHTQAIALNNAKQKHWAQKSSRPIRSNIVNRHV